MPARLDQPPVAFEIQTAGDNPGRDAFLAGEVFYQGNLGVPADLDQAIVRYREASDLGESRADLRLAFHWLVVTGGEAVREEGLRHLHQAIAARDPFAMILATYLFEYTPWRGWPTDDAVLFLDAIAAGGNPEAIYLYALSREVLGPGLDSTTRASYARAAAAGDQAAALRIRALDSGVERPAWERFLADQLGWAPVDEADAQELLRSAAAQDHPDALLALAGRISPTETGARVGLLLRAAEQESAGAMLELAKLGLFHPDPALLDPVRGMRWMIEAAKRRDREAQYRLGLLYLDRDGPAPVDEVAAVAWLQRASDAGFLDARFALGRILAEGPAFLRQPDAARHLFEGGARVGHPGAKFQLARMLVRGEGGAVDLAQAFRILATLDTAEAAALLEEIAPQVPAEVAANVSSYSHLWPVSHAGNTGVSERR